jgi:hypothetical protein
MSKDFDRTGSFGRRTPLFVNPVWNIEKLSQANTCLLICRWTSNNRKTLEICPVIAKM